MLKLLGKSFDWIVIPSVAICMTLWPALSTGLERMPVYPGDTLLNVYFLEHAFQHLTEGNLLNPDKFWSPNYFWPIEGVLAWSDHLLGQSILYGLFRPFFDKFESYTVWLGLTLWLNYISIRIAAQKISPQTNKSWLSIAALATTFSPAILQQLSHPQLLSLYFIGPILILNHKLINKEVNHFTLSDWFFLGSCVLANGFFNIYIFVYACYGTLVCAIIHIIKRFFIGENYLKKGEHILLAFSSLVVSISLNIVIYTPYLKTLDTFGKRPITEIIDNLPKPASWIFSSNQWLLKGPLSYENVNPNWVYGAEQELFPGWLLLSLISAAIITTIWKRKTIQNGLNAWLLVSATMLLLSISINTISFWPLVCKILPGASSLRASSRVGMMVILFSTPSIALAAKYWSCEIRYSFKALASTAAVIGGLMSILSINPRSFSLSNWKLENKLLSSKLNESNCSVFWYQWQAQYPWRGHVMAMHLQQQTGIPTVNGYSGQFPKNNWPYAHPSGQGAFRWILRNSSMKIHSMRSVKKAKKRCIITKAYDQNPIIAELNKEDPAKFSIITIASPQKIIYEGDEISIGIKYDHLYYRINSNKISSRWTMLSRDEMTIPANRGQFKIAKATFSVNKNGNEFTVIDRNAIQGIEHIWTINKHTGKLIEQATNIIP